MADTTVNSMNLLMQKKGHRISGTISKTTKELMEQAKKELGLNESMFIRVAIVEKLERFYS